MIAEVDVAVVGGRIAGCVVAAMFADALSVRREALDAVLAARARRAGAEVIDRCRVVDLVSVDARVEGIVLAHASGRSEIRSRLAG